MNRIEFRWVLWAPLLVGVGMGCGSEAEPTGSPDKDAPQQAAAVVHPLEARESYPAGELPSNALTGEDADGDLIRDDVERFIEARWATQPKVFLAQRQVARAYQHLMAVGEDRNAARAGIDALFEALACADALDEQGSKRGKETLEAVFDDEARVRQYIHYHGLLGGQVLSPPADSVDFCAFDLEGL